jgi:hypothetical protein
MEVLIIIFHNDAALLPLGGGMFLEFVRSNFKETCEDKYGKFPVSLCEITCGW